MKRYIRASITSEVNDIVNSKNDVRYHEHFESFWDMAGLEWFLSQNPNITDYDVIEISPDSPDYQTYRGGLNLDYYNPPKSYFVLKWTSSERYNATRVEELNALLKRVKTYEELKELYNAISNTGYGIWFYTKRSNRPLNSTFTQYYYDPEYVTYIVDGHDASLKCKISNLYRVLTIY